MKIGRIGSSFPQGAIIMWAGTIATIPTGWVICDGNNGTPNLLARFVKGVATAATDPGLTGGAATHTHAGHAAHASAGAHTHDAHTTNDDTPSGGTAQIAAPVTHASDGGHTHDAHSAHDTPNSEPAYYALAFIMKT